MSIKDSFNDKNSIQDFSRRIRNLVHKLEKISGITPKSKRIIEKIFYLCVDLETITAIDGKELTLGDKKESTLKIKQEVNEILFNTKNFLIFF